MLERGVLANRAKYLATEVGLEVTVQGHPDRRRPRRLQGLSRPSAPSATSAPPRSCRPTMDRMLEAIGKSALGLDAAMFNIPGTPPR